MKPPKLKMIFMAVALGSPIAFGAHLLNDHQNTLEAEKLIELQDKEILAEKKQGFYYNAYGEHRSSFEYAYQHYSEHVDDDYLHSITTAEFARKEGVHPVAILPTIAAETGFDVYVGDSKPAQGVLQAIPEWHIDLFLVDGKNTKFYAGLDHNDPRKETIDELHRQPFPTSQDRQNLADKIHDAFLVNDPNDDSLAKRLSDIRFDNEAMVRTFAVKRRAENPQLSINNIAKMPADDAIEIIMAHEIVKYGQHNFGKKGWRFADRLGNEPPEGEKDYRHIKFSDIDAVQTAINEVAPQLGYALEIARNAEQWYKDASDNKGPYGGLPDDMTLGHIPKSLSAYIELKANLFMNDLKQIIDITHPTRGQSFENFQETEIDVIGQYQAININVTKSPRPKTRPADLTDGIVSIEKDSGYTLRPRARPKDQTPS